MTRSVRLASIAGVALLAGQASADAILSFGFTDMAGSFAGGQFTVTNDGDTSGDVTRIEPVSGSAHYDVGFAGGSVIFDISVFNIGANTADGAGTFTITDADGDTLTGDIVGVWIRGALGTFFNGDLSNVVITSDDGTFDGPSGGSFDTALSGTPPYLGSIVQLFIGPNFFTADFDVESVQVEGEVIPAPGAMALLGCGGLLAVRRRRA